MSSNPEAQLSLNVDQGPNHPWVKRAFIGTGGFLALVGASDIFNFDIPFIGSLLDLNAKSHVEVTVPELEVFNVYPEQTMCFAVAEGKVTPQMKIESSIGWGPASYTAEILNLSVDVKGDTESCADAEDTAWHVTIDPTNPANSHAEIKTNLHSSRPRVTNLGEKGTVHGGLEGPWDFPGIPAPDVTRATGTLQELGQKVMGNGVCNVEAQQTGAESARKFFTDVSVNFGVPAQNVKVDVQVPTFDDSSTPQQRSEAMLPNFVGSQPEGVTITVQDAVCGGALETPTGDGLRKVPVDNEQPPQQAQGTGR